MADRPSSVGKGYVIGGALAVDTDDTEDEEGSEVCEVYMLWCGSCTPVERYPMSTVSARVGGLA